MTEHESYEQASTMTVGAAVVLALDAAHAMPDIQGTDGEVHRHRSQNFVECLGAQMRALYADAGTVAVLTKHNAENRARFGMNELLYDVAVVEYATVNSGKSARELTYVTRGLWLIESELARDKRQALYEFNKLVLGDAENKLFIGPRNAVEDEYLRALAEPAKHCVGNLSLALIPHPDQWPVVQTGEVRVWHWDRSVWVSV